MSAIAGILRFDGVAPDGAALANVAAAMASHGADGIAHWHGGPVALTHCMLRTTPESRGEVQPLLSADGHQVLVFEGRLDNRDELQRELGLARDAAVWSDARLLMAAWERWGESCMQRLLGDFAFALWDARMARLFCAVDHVGACQIYYTANERFFAFASTEEALLALPGVSSEPNEHMLIYMQLLAFHTFEPGSTWLRDVKVMGPGQCASVTTDRELRLREYWSLQVGELLPITSQQEAQHEFRRVFDEAVRCRLRSEGPVAHMLSGGIDSAAIRGSVEAVRGDLPELVYRTYSVTSPGATDCVETRCIQHLAHGADATFLPIPQRADSVEAQDLLEAAWSRPHPCDNSILLPAWVCQTAARRGDRVMLYGVGGDLATYLPQRYVAYLLRQREWARAWSECRQAALNHTSLRGAHPLRLLAANLWTAFAPTALKRLAFMAKPWQPPTRGSGVAPAAVSRWRIDDTLRTRRAAGRKLAPTVEQALLKEALTSAHGVAAGLAGFARLGKRYGLEMRDPWCDRRVLEFFLRVPLRFKVANGWTKALVRNAYDGLLDPAVRWRTGKEHLGAQLIYQTMEWSSERARHAVEVHGGLAAHVMDRAEVCRRLHAYFDDAVASPVGECDFVYNRVAMLLWLKRLADRRERGNILFQNPPQQVHS